MYYQKPHFSLSNNKEIKIVYQIKTKTKSRVQEWEKSNNNNNNNNNNKNGFIVIISFKLIKFIIFSKIITLNKKQQKYTFKENSFFLYKYKYYIYFSTQATNLIEKYIYNQQQQLEWKTCTNFNRLTTTPIKSRAASFLYIFCLGKLTHSICINNNNKNNNNNSVQ